MAKGKIRIDRYDLAEARDLGQRGRPTTTKNIETSTVAVEDPRPDRDSGPGQRVLATVNRRVDILEHERAHGRISNDAYREGRLVQALFERAGLSGGSTWSDGARVDAEVAKELKIIRRLDDSRLIGKMVDEIEKTLGAIDARIVRQVLGDNRSYAQVAQPLDLKSAAARAGAADWQPLGRGGWQKPARGDVRRARIGYVAQRFRDALETLAARKRQRRGSRGAQTDH